MEFLLLLGNTNKHLRTSSTSCFFSASFYSNKEIWNYSPQHTPENVDCRGRKEWQTFSVSEVFEVGAFFFPWSQPKVLPCHEVIVWPKGCDAADLYSPPDGIAAKHPRAGQPHTHQISNQIQIHEVCLGVCERADGSIDRTSSRQWWRVSRKRCFRAVWFFNEGKIKMIFEKSSPLFPPFFESGQESVSVS